MHTKYEKTKLQTSNVQEGISKVNIGLYDKDLLLLFHSSDQLM